MNPTIQDLFATKPISEYSSTNFQDMIHKAMEYIPFIKNKTLDWAEFGVFEGRTAVLLYDLFLSFREERDLAECYYGDFHLFDSFEGNPGDWVVDGKIHTCEGGVRSESGNWPTFRKGVFSTQGFLPQLVQQLDQKPHIILHKGLFEHQRNTIFDPLSFVHIDCDLYSSTKEALALIAPFLFNGSVLLFDEFFGYGGDGWLDHEFKAFREFILETGFRFEYLARQSSHRVLIRLEM